MRQQHLDAYREMAATKQGLLAALSNIESALADYRVMIAEGVRDDTLIIDRSIPVTVGWLDVPVFTRSRWIDRLIRETAETVVEADHLFAQGSIDNFSFSTPLE